MGGGSLRTGAQKPPFQGKKRSSSNRPTLEWRAVAAGARLSGAGLVKRLCEGQTSGPAGVTGKGDAEDWRGWTLQVKIKG